MSGNTLSLRATLQCPHGGQVQIIGTNTRVKADGAFVATVADNYVITGCPYQIPAAPSPIPSPCVRVQWMVPDARNQVGGSFTLSSASTGLCLSAAGIPQGQVIIADTQTRARSA